MRRDKIETFATFLSVLLGSINIAMFILWWRMIDVDSVPYEEIAKYEFSHLGIQIAVLTTIIGFGALVLGVLNFFSYRSMVEVARNRADEVARQVANSYCDDYFGPTGSPKRPRKNFQNPDVGDVEEKQTDS